MSHFGRDLNTVIGGYQMRLLVWRVVNKTLKFRLTFVILLTINSPLTTTRREKRLFSLLVTVKLKPKEIESFKN